MYGAVPKLVLLASRLAPTTFFYRLGSPLRTAAAPTPARAPGLAAAATAALLALGELEAQVARRVGQAVERVAAVEPAAREACGAVHDPQDTPLHGEDLALQRLGGEGEKELTFAAASGRAPEGKPRC